MTKEHAIMNQIRAAVSPYCTIFRINVGKGYTKDGRYFDTGVPVGFSDLFGVRHRDGRAVFIEVKTSTGQLSLKQETFLTAMSKAGAVTGVCHSAEEAVNLIIKE